VLRFDGTNNITECKPWREIGKDIQVPIHFTRKKSSKR
jgi:hypothetical protein